MSTPLFMKDASVTLALVGPPAGTEAEFNCDLKSAVIEDTPGDDVTYATLCPDGSYTRKGAATYVLHLTGPQEWDVAGLSRFLWDNEGELATFVVQAHGAAVPISDTEPGFTGTVTLIAGDYGGEVETFAEFDVSLPCNGRPTLLVAPPTTLEAAVVEAA